MLNPNIACILGELYCFRAFGCLFLSNLMALPIKLGSQLFQNNALVKVPCTLKLISAKEHGIKLLLLLQENRLLKRQY